MRLPKVFLILLVPIYLLVLTLGGVFGVDCTTEQDCANQINQQNTQLTQIQQQQAALQAQLDAAKKNLNSTAAQLASMQSQVNAINAQLTQATTDLNNAQGILDKNKAIFRARVREDYINSNVSGWELIFGNSYSFADSAQDGGLRLALMNRTHNAIVQYSGEVKDLSTVRDQVAASQQTATSQLAQLQAIKASQSAQVAGIQKNQSSLSSQVAQISANLAGLTSKQQEIIAAKLAATQQSSSVGSAAPVSVPLGNSPFNPGFAFLTYGYIHRGGMNQYGAYGRALSGVAGVSDFQSILHAYYGLNATAANVPATITVNGCNDYGQCFYNQVFNFEDYLKHLYEMPTSWPLEALKAQAIAARTYAMRYGSVICPSQSCQEVKVEINSTAWQQAVDATAGMTLGGNNPIVAYYSSTDGGYTCNPPAFHYGDQCNGYLHDVDGSGQSYDGPAYGNSPWFHKAWGTNSNGGTSWLSAAEAGDIFNALALSQVNSSYNQYLSPIDQGGWSIQQVRDQLAALGKNSVDAAATISVGFDGAGNTNYIWVYGVNGVYYRFSGTDFQSMFNLRSPGTLGIKTSLFDVTKSQ